MKRLSALLVLAILAIPSILLVGCANRHNEPPFEHSNDGQVRFTPITELRTANSHFSFTVIGSNGKPHTIAHSGGDIAARDFEICEHGELLIDFADNFAVVSGAPHLTYGNQYTYTKARCAESPNLYIHHDNIVGGFAQIRILRVLSPTTVRIYFAMYGGTL